MPIYKIADLNIEINPKYEKTSKQLAAYITDEKTADFCVEAEQSEIDRLVAGGGIDYLSESCIINTLVCREILDNYGGRVQMINDDKPIIRKKGGVFYVYGTPWMVKSNIGANISAPLGAVFLLERDRVNYAEKVSAGKVFPKLLEATLISKKQDRMSKILELYDEIFSAVDLYSLHCTISDDAVTAAYDAICK